jgi:16S rRNA (uracil1498-N3)-methyltransferase
VNLILFEPGEAEAPLALTDPRAEHLLRVLRRKVGDRFDAGIVGGPRGRGTLAAIGTDALTLEFTWGPPPPPPDPIHLLVALPRPQTARKILHEATSLGVASIRFFPSEKGEPGYASSTLWRDGEWRRHLLEGAAQSFDTRVPEIRHDPGLAEALASLPAGGTRIALDNYEATRRMAPAPFALPVTLAFGPERGWSGPERDRLRAAAFEVAHLGPRVLRTETAVVAALAVLQAGL